MAGDAGGRFPVAASARLETAKVSAFHRRFSIVPVSGGRVRIGPVTAKDPDSWHRLPEQDYARIIPARCFWRQCSLNAAAPHSFITRLKLYPSVSRLNSPRPFSSPRIRKWSSPAHRLMMPRGYQTSADLWRIHGSPGAHLPAMPVDHVFMLPAAPSPPRLRLCQYRQLRK